MSNQIARSINFYAGLCYRLILILFIYTLCRLGFYAFNSHLFNISSFHKFVIILSGGIKFDISALLYINSLYLILQLLPFKFRYKLSYQSFSKWLFIATNAVGILANFIDFVYYKFTLKRTTADFAGQFRHEQNLFKLLFNFISDYWYLLLIFVILIWVFIKLYDLFKVKEPKYYVWPNYVLNTIILAVSVALIIGGIRGGWAHSTRPITMSNAGEFVDSPNEISLVLNTPFCLIRSLTRKPLQKMDYFDEQTLEKTYSLLHQPESKAPFKKLNVVFLIIESLGKEHVGSLNTDLLNGTYKGYTPFIDSLVANSYTFTHTYANGRKSIDALPSVISGIPSVCGPFVLGNYSGNKTTSIAKLLGAKGYETAFFHGAPNGSMGFSSYTHLAGIEHYYGKTEYNNDADFDGVWGIWDEPFMQFMANKINTFKQPFFSSFFSLSSHHPFKVPEKYKNKFPKGPLEVQEPMGYTDMALKKFFATASKMPWYKNTLFVLCADHATVSYLPEYQTTAGYFSIPILFYYPGGDLKGKTNKNVQQIDIMPTVLNYLNYDKPYLAFGNDAFKNDENKFVVNHNDGTYNLYKGDFLLVSDGKISKSLYNLKEDRLNKNNLIGKLQPVQNDLERYLKAFIQQYNNRMIENKLTLNN